MQRAPIYLLIALMGGCTTPSTKAPASVPAAQPASAEVAAPSGAALGAVADTWRSRAPATPVVDPAGMVSTDARLATEVGSKVLASGGNAVDSAVAVAFALAVVFPEAGNIGGGGFMVYRDPGGESVALDFREMAPAAASRDMYLDPETAKPTPKSKFGALAAGVPGTVAGLWAAHSKHGTLPWKDLVAPAIQLAEEGFIVDEAVADGLKSLQKRMAVFPSTAALFYPGGEPLAVGTRFKNPTLGQTLRRIAENGPSGFYEGATADLIVAEMKRSGGIITHADLKAYRPIERAPIRVSYRGHQIVSMPPPSSGGLVIALMARVLEKTDLGALGWHSTAHVHHVAEAMRHAFARRNAHLGDPDFVDIPAPLFNSEEAAQSVLTAFDPMKATPSSEVSGGAAPSEGRNTTNLAVVDPMGGAVALTYTLNLRYGSGVVVDGGGFLLNDEMDDFAAAPGKANAYGLVQGEANAIAPGKRPLSSMTPTIVADADGKVRLVTGAAGGPTIITASFQVLSAVVDFGMDIQTAVAEPRFHHQHLPDRLFMEKGAVSDDVKSALEGMGYAISSPPFPIGDAPSIARSPAGWMGGLEVRQFGAAGAGPSGQ
ncbi:MAG: gamma-glutamyltransferase, partial [Myxococcota bacterium]